MKTATSIQYMTFKKHLTLEQITREYFLWLPTLFGGPIKTIISDDLSSVTIALGLIPLLKLERIPDEIYRFSVIGGLLSKEGGEFCFSIEGHKLKTALTDFSPRLPWPIYRISQYPFHDLVMYLFSEHLKILR